MLRDGAALRRFWPGRLPLRQTRTLETSRALEAYARSSTTIPQSIGGRRLVLSVPQLSEVDGTIEAREADLPLVVPRRCGDSAR